MENNNLDQLREEEILNIEQFQVGRSLSPEEEAEQNAANPDAGYTDQEVQFADGKDSPLNEAQGPEEEEDDEDDIVVDDPEDDEINIDDPDEEFI